MILCHSQQRADAITNQIRFYKFYILKEYRDFYEFQLYPHVLKFKLQFSNGDTVIKLRLSLKYKKNN